MCQRPRTQSLASACSCCSCRALIDMVGFDFAKVCSSDTGLCHEGRYKVETALSQPDVLILCLDILAGAMLATLLRTLDVAQLKLLLDVLQVLRHLSIILLLEIILHISVESTTSSASANPAHAAGHTTCRSPSCPLAPSSELPGSPPRHSLPDTTGRDPCKEHIQTVGPTRPGPTMLCACKCR